MVKLEPIETQDRLYVRVARRIENLVSSGEVGAGDKLPSERDLAEMLQVSRPSIRLRSEPGLVFMLQIEVGGFLPGLLMKGSALLKFWRCDC